MPRMIPSNPVLSRQNNTCTVGRNNRVHDISPRFKTVFLVLSRIKADTALHRDRTITHSTCKWACLGAVFKWVHDCTGCLTQRGETGKQAVVPGWICYMRMEAFYTNFRDNGSHFFLFSPCKISACLAYCSFSC